MTDGYPTGRHAAGAIPWLFAGALVVVAVFGIAFAVLITGNSSPSGSGQHKQQPLAAASPLTTTAPAQSPSPSASTHKHKSSHSSSPGPVPSSTQQQAPPNPATVHLTTSVSANSWKSSQGGWVAFQVDNTGSAAAGQVTVTITLPAGAAMSGDGGGGGGGGGDASLSPFAGHSHWSCQPTSTGATCTLAGLAAGNQARGGISFTVSGSSVCGQPVDLTATSGPAWSSAQSAIAC